MSHGERKSVKVKEKVSRQKKISNGKRTDVTAKEKEYVSRQKKMSHAKRKLLTAKQGKS